MATKATSDTPVIQIPPIDIRTLIIPIIGDSPLIVHKWSNKAKQEMLDKQMKKAKQAKAAKDPHQDYLDSLYHMSEPGHYGFPAIGFKAAAVAACRFVDGVAMTEARGAFHINGTRGADPDAGELIEVIGEPRMREDMVRVGMGTADIRYRGEFPEWAATLPIRYNANALSAAQIVNLFDLAGFGVGVGEWRPSSKSGGQYGRFHVYKDGE